MKSQALNLNTQISKTIDQNCYISSTFAFQLEATFHARNRLTIIVQFYVCNKCTIDKTNGITWLNATLFSPCCHAIKTFLSNATLVLIYLAPISLCCNYSFFYNLFFIHPRAFIGVLEKMVLEFLEHTSISISKQQLQ